MLRLILFVVSLSAGCELFGGKCEEPPEEPCTREENHHEFRCGACGEAWFCGDRGGDSGSVWGLSDFPCDCVLPSGELADTGYCEPSI